MPEEYKPTTPKPFVFVLMPFDEKFDDVYEVGIKDAVEKAGAHAERVDEQMFDEEIIERVFNQISRADVLVADMTGQNPNVFYEVGYAHALGKIVLLLTQDSGGIPFDLNHRFHIVYEGSSIHKLRETLTDRLRWAVQESKDRASTQQGSSFSVWVEGGKLMEETGRRVTPLRKVEAPAPRGGWLELQACLRNDSLVQTDMVRHVYLITPTALNLWPCKVEDYTVYYGGGNQARRRRPLRLNPLPLPAGDREQDVQMFRLDVQIPPLPPGAIEEFPITFVSTQEKWSDTDGTLRLRFHAQNGVRDFGFHIRFAAGEAASQEQGKGRAIKLD